MKSFFNGIIIVCCVNALVYCALLYSAPHPISTRDFIANRVAYTENFSMLALNNFGVYQFFWVVPMLLIAAVISYYIKQSGLVSGILIGAIIVWFIVTFFKTFQ